MIKKYLLSIFIIIIFISSLIILEIIFQFKYGKPPKLSMDKLHYQFEMQYIDIYKKFFRKISSPDGSLVYKSQRKYTNVYTFPVYKSKDTKRIFILGGSVADAFSFNIYLLFQIFEKINLGIKFEIVNCGVGGYDSYRELLVLKEIIHYKPDLIILLSGNNEFYTPVYINLFKYKLNKLLSNFWIYRFIQKLIVKFFKINTSPKVISQQERLRIFEANLKRMAYITKKRNIPFAICTLPVNFKDCPLFIQAPWHIKEFFLAYQLYEKKRYSEAKEAFIDFIKNHPYEILGYYFLANSYEKLKIHDKAKELYMNTLDIAFEHYGFLSGCYPFKNEIIRKICKNEDLILIDLEKAFIDYAPYGITDYEIFYDNVHWYTEYNFLVFKEIVKSIINYNKYHSRWIFDKGYTELYCDNLYFNKIFSDFSIYKETLEERGFKILFNAFERYGQLLVFNNNLNFIIIDERTINSLQKVYEFNSELFKNLYTLKENLFSEFSKISKHRVFLKAIPIEETWIVILIHIGEMFRRMGEYDKAIQYFLESIKLNSNFYFPYLGIAISKYKLGLVDEAKKYFFKAENMPDSQPLVQYWKEYLGL